MVGAALRRVRVLIAAVVGMPLLVQALTDGGPAPTKVGYTTALVVGMVVTVHFISKVAQDTHRRGLETALHLVELSADVSLVLAVITVFPVLDPNVAWILLVIPVLEGALRFQLWGAFFSWVVVSAGYLAFVWQSFVPAGASMAAPDLAQLETAIQRLALVLLTALPAGYLSEQLLRAISAMWRAHREAVIRGARLETVARTAQQIARLDSHPLGSVVVGLAELGFSACDVCRFDGSTWSMLGRWSASEDVSLPSPGSPGAGLERALGQERTVVLERRAAPSRQVAILAAGGLEAVVVAPLRGVDSFALRAGLPAGLEPTPDLADCVALLGGQLEVALRNNTLVEELRGLRDDLQHQAFHDPLTSVANRARFMTSLEEAVERSAEEVAVLFIDLNGFKQVNDRHGHETGDQLLVYTARRLDESVRDGDLVARLGGDEFTILMRGCGTEAAAAVCKRLLRSLCEELDVNGDRVRLGATIGIAVKAGGRRLSASELLRRADAAMYHEKQNPSIGWRSYPSDEGGDSPLLSALGSPAYDSGLKKQSALRK